MLILAKYNLHNTDNIIIELIILKWRLLAIIVERNFLLILKLLPLNIIINNALSGLWWLILTFLYLYWHSYNRICQSCSLIIHRLTACTINIDSIITNSLIFFSLYLDARWAAYKTLWRQTMTHVFINKKSCVKVHYIFNCFC